MGRLDGPVPAIEGEQAFRRCGLRGQAGDAVSRLAAPFMRLWKSRNEASVYLMWSPPWVGSIFGRFRRVETLLASVAPQVRIPTFYPGGCRQGCAESVPPIPLAAGAAFRRDDADAAAAQWRLVADQLKPKAPKLAALMDEAQHDVLAYMSFPKEHRAKLHSTNPLERVNGEIKRRTNVVGIFPNDDAITRLVGAVLLEQNDEWTVGRRYMTLDRANLSKRLVGG